MQRPLALLAAMSIGLVLLSGCTPAAEPVVEEETVAPAPVEPEPVATPTLGPIEADTTVVIRALATAPNGAQLELQMQVHASTPFDDIATATLPQVMEEVCAGTLDARVFSEQLWSFTRVNVTAVPTEASTADWPAEAPLGVRPSAQTVAVAARGILTDIGDAPTPLCQQEKVFSSAGTGGMAVGIPQDSGIFTKWLGHQYGFVGAGLSECTFEVTGVGAAANAAGWTQVADGSGCYIGPASEVQEY